MRDNTTLKGAIAALAAAFLLSGCSSVAEIPYPNLSEIVRGEAPSLSPEERAAMIEELKQEQQTHKAAAVEDIEKR